MNFTFGIITRGDNPRFLKNSIKSIESLNLQDYEIIIVGGESLNIRNNNTIHIKEEGKLTYKKNIITDNAKYENVVYCHDYILFDKDWYNGFLEFGNDFNVCINKILNKNGERYRDWTLWPKDVKGIINSRNFLIPYDMTHLTERMYISGAYWVAKREFMINNRLNEDLSWGEGEDVEWSKRVRKQTEFKINPNSIVHLQKFKDRIFGVLTDEEAYTLMNLKE